MDGKLRVEGIDDHSLTQGFIARTTFDNCEPIVNAAYSLTAPARPLNQIDAAKRMKTICFMHRCSFVETPDVERRRKAAGPRMRSFEQFVIPRRKVV